MSANVDHYLSNYYGHTATPRALEWNANSLMYHHGKHFPLDQSAAILEIGPGMGNVLNLLREQCGYNNATAVDISPEVVDHCNRRHAGCTELAGDTTAYLRRYSEAFDVILMLHVLEHIGKDDAPGLLQAARGALKTGGKLIIEVPNAVQPVVGAANFYSDFTHLVGYANTSLETVLRSAGFTDISIYACKIAPKNPLRAFQRLAQDTIELIFWLLLRAYGPSRHILLASHLGACATK